MQMQQTKKQPRYYDIVNPGRYTEYANVPVGKATRIHASRVLEQWLNVGSKEKSILLIDFICLGVYTTLTPQGKRHWDAVIERGVVSGDDVDWLLEFCLYVNDVLPEQKIKVITEYVEDEPSKRPYKRKDPTVNKI
jgi:hypothetical protein